MANLRPLLDKILDDETPAAAKPILLEAVAESCVSQASVSRDLHELRAAYEEFIAVLTQLHPDTDETS